ncbi:hypothetical protein PDESU_03310 [Pontiella desulfatans]|uniref:Uncharacterized protein n=1 Tax=Pontiella desulfatans TaxID=2750659 RepID=A0A6C2U5C6_PONDE|nr:hypothetical protein [Pontiella desulfatans]VGO14741.1 hypothetical protein PDESU_03310 [Pontiella desulfatans]
MATKLATISGVKFGVDQETAYDVIITSISETHSSEETPLKDETGAIVATNIEGIAGELQIDFAIKGTNSLASDALIGTVISDITDSEFQDEYIVVGVSRVRAEGQWMKGTLTAKNYGTGFTTAA